MLKSVSILILASALFGTSACSVSSDETVDGAGGTDATSGGGNNTTSGGGEVDDERFVRGLFEAVDGMDVSFEATSRLTTATISGTLLYTCEGQTNDRALGVTFTADTVMGDHPSDLGDGPYMIMAWPQADGTGIRASAGGQGTITFAEIGFEPGDVIAGTADVTLSPEADDPNDLYRAVRNIEFRCEVP